MLTLEVKPRESSESKDALRSRGVLPAVFYGPKEDSTAIAIDMLQFERTLRLAGQTSVVTLKGAGVDKETLLHDVQYHPVTGRPVHADFYVLEKGKKVEIAVPIEFAGQAPAEKAGHIISKALHEIEIEVAPAELPHSLIVDLTKLANVGDHITAGQIALPPSATLITHADEIVASVMEFKEEKMEAPVAPGVAAPVDGEAAAVPETTAEGSEEKKA